MNDVLEHGNYPNGFAERTSRSVAKEERKSEGDDGVCRPSHLHEPDSRSNRFPGTLLEWHRADQLAANGRTNSRRPFYESAYRESEGNEEVDCARVLFRIRGRRQCVQYSGVSSSRSNGSLCKNVCSFIDT